MKTFKESFIEKYPKYEVILSYYNQANDIYPEWDNFTKARLSAFVNLMREKVAASSARQYAAKFKAVMNLYSDQYELPHGYADILSLRDEKSVNIFLSIEDLKRLEAYQPKNNIEESVLYQFLIGAYSGCRYSDFSRITEENIQDGYLHYVSQKTHILAVVPLKAEVMIWLKRTGSMDVNPVTFNSTIRRICKKSGINDRVKVFKAGREEVGEKWEFVSSHTARRSFATNLYLRGADIYSISRMLGHSSVEMTAKNYLCCPLRDQSQAVLDYFK